MTPTQRFWNLPGIKQVRQIQSMYDALWSIHMHTSRELANQRTMSIDYQNELMRILTETAEQALTPLDPPSWRPTKENA